MAASTVKGEDKIRLTVQLGFIINYSRDIMTQLNNNLFNDIPEGIRKEINPYVTELMEGQENGSLPVLFGPNLLGIRGNWSQKFKSFLEGSDTNDLILEIGCHKGNTLREMATKFLNLNFIGMDITYKRVVYSAKRAKNAELKNVMAVLGNAKQMDAIFEEGELDGVIIFFPDPWSKKSKQSKNRLVSEEFSELLFKVIKPGGFLWFKTDDDNYFSDTSSYLNKAGFVLSEAKSGLPAEKFETTFERKFRLMGESTNEGHWIHPGAVN
jgi:tRNA (guanine-N7-)-methyltransferase